MAIVTKNSKIVDKNKEQLKQRIARQNNRNFDPRFIQFQAGHKYVLRLVGYEDSDYPRTTYFNRVMEHVFKDEEAGKTHSVICPRTFNDRAKCPICNTCYGWYKEGSQAEKDLNQKLKARFHGFGVAYVVKDSLNPENEGQIKLFHYVPQMEEVFDLAIDGTSRKYKSDAVEPDEDEEVLGDDAFYILGHPDRGDKQSGFNLKINVTKTGKYNEYHTSFTRNKTSVAIDMDTLVEALTELKFDEDFYKSSTSEEVEEFHKQFVANATGGEVAEVDGDILSADDDEDLLDEGSLDDDILPESAEIDTDLSVGVDEDLFSGSDPITDEVIGGDDDLDIDGLDLDFDI